MILQLGIDLENGWINWLNEVIPRLKAFENKDNP
jgi:hypothetical protein